MNVDNSHKRYPKTSVPFHRNVVKMNWKCTQALLIRIRGKEYLRYCVIV